MQEIGNKQTTNDQTSEVQNQISSGWFWNPLISAYIKNPSFCSILAIILEFTLGGIIAIDFLGDFSPSCDLSHFWRKLDTEQQCLRT